MLNLNPVFYLAAMSNPIGANGEYGPSSLYLYAFAPSALYLLWRKERRAALPVAWFGFVFAYLAVGPMHISLNPPAYYIIPEVWRYLTLLAVPMAVAIAIAISSLLNESPGVRGTRKRKRPIAWLAACVAVLVAVLLISSFWSTIATYNGVMAGLANDKSMGSYLSKLTANATIYIPTFLPYSLAFAQLYSNGSVGFSNITQLTKSPACSDVHGPATVVLPASWLNATQTAAGEVPRCSDWTLALQESGYASAYHVNAT